MESSHCLFFVITSVPTESIIHAALNHPRGQSASPPGSVARPNRGMADVARVARPSRGRKRIAPSDDSVIVFVTARIVRWLCRLHARLSCDCLHSSRLPHAPPATAAALDGCGWSPICGEISRDRDPTRHCTSLALPAVHTACAAACASQLLSRAVLSVRRCL